MCHSPLKDSKYALCAQVMSLTVAEVGLNRVKLRTGRNARSRTDRAMVVCDIQGVRSQKDTLTITDPQIHTADKSDDFGAGNGQSEDHIRSFFASHECKDTCRCLGLVHPFPEDLVTGISRVHQNYSWRPFFQRKNYFTAGFLQSHLLNAPSTTPSAPAGGEGPGRREKAS